MQIYSNSMIRIVFATIAIGIGVNIPSVRQVIHVGAARTLESHYQKIGRGGRDEKSTKVSYTRVARTLLPTS